MSSNFLPPRKKRALSPTPPEPIQQPAAMGAKKPRKTNMGNEMRKKNRRLTMPKV